jgi:hypothetical protein
MMSSTAKAHARQVTAAKTSEVTSAETADVTAAEATDVSSAKAAHVASAASVSSATATAGLRIRSKKAAGKCCTCQNHHHSSSHDILLGMGGFSATGPRQMPAGPREANADIAMGCRWGWLFVVSIKFPFNHPNWVPGAARIKGKRAAGRRLD